MAQDMDKDFFSMEGKARKRPSVFIVGLVVLVLLSVLCVRPGVWMNLAGTFAAPFAVPTVAIFDLTSNPHDLDNYVPLDIYAGVFDGAWRELVSRKAMTDEDFQIDEGFLEGYQSEMELKSISWYSLWSWGCIILAAFYTKRLAKLQQEKNQTTGIHIIGMWACFAVIPLICEITVTAFHFINVNLMFVLAGCAATGIFMAAHPGQGVISEELEMAQTIGAMGSGRVGITPEEAGGSSAIYREARPENAAPEKAREEPEDSVALLLRLQAEEEAKRASDGYPALPEEPRE